LGIRQVRSYPRRGETENDRSVVGSTDNGIVEVFHAFFEEVRRYCAYRLFGPDLAEDAALDVFVRLKDQWPTLQGKTKAEIRRWLYGTASNVVARYLRDADRQKRVVAELVRWAKQKRAHSSEVTDGPDWPRVYRAVSRLTPRDQSIVTMRYFEGLEIVEIAKSLGMTRVGVRVRLFRAIKALKRELGVDNE
jgi:RNA polymerase sigma-70 factor, ECF subfamily